MRLVNNEKAPPMRPPGKALMALSFILVISASTLFAQPYTFDENGNGIQYIAYLPFPLSYQLAPDPSRGITTSPVLIYSLGEPVVSGDVALMESDGTTIADLLRFFTPFGGSSSYVIFYSRTAGPTHPLADVGIPFSANPLRINEGSGNTLWHPGANQPGMTTLGAIPVFAHFEYQIITDVPEPAAVVLVWVATGVGLTVRGSRRKGFSVREVSGS